MLFFNLQKYECFINNNNIIISIFRNSIIDYKAETAFPFLNSS